MYVPAKGMCIKNVKRKQLLYYRYTQKTEKIQILITAFLYLLIHLSLVFKEHVYQNQNI